MSASAPGIFRRRLPWAAAALWVLPLWVVAFPPMVDYPQQLALSAILRWYSDPVRRFRETYELALWTPHGLFKLLTAGLAWVMPIEVTGKVVVSASLLVVGAAALALCRRSGAPGWYALLALALTYNSIFYWGFVDNLLALPLALGGAALADRLFEGPFGTRPWLALAAVCLLFYNVHLQYLLLFAGMVGWLAICRWPGWRRFALWLSALLPGVAACGAVMAYGVLRTPVGVISEYEQRMRSAPPMRLSLGIKLARIPDILFGTYPNRTGWVLLGLLAATAVAAILFRDRTGGPSWLFRSRFATLASWVPLLHLIFPECRGGYLIAERVAPLAAMLAVVALPALADTRPGENLAGLIFERTSASWPGMPVYLHTPAYYQVEKGGRILFSFAELFQTSARFRPGKSWDDLLREWNDWNPQFFDYGRDGGRFRYFLVRGGPRDVLAAFGGDPKRLGLTGKMAGEWWLFERNGPSLEKAAPSR